MIAHDYDKVLQRFIADIAPEFRKLARQIWQPPSRLSDRLNSTVSQILNDLDTQRVVVTGETHNQSLYIVGLYETIAYSPFADFSNSPVFREVSVEVLKHIDEHLFLLRSSAELEKRLTMPIVVLINPCVPEIFPVARLPLCICSLAAYLRRRQKAEVHVIDMQLDSDPDAAVQTALSLKPSIVGISVNFGQANLTFEMLKRLYAAPKAPLTVLGNVIAAFGAAKFLELYPRVIVATREGEVTLSELVEYVKGDRPIEQVNGIMFRASGETKETPAVGVPMDDVPLPSMDCVETLIAQGGALTLELSRGCPHSACSFCPRTHKPRQWKGIPAEKALDQLEWYAEVLDHLHCERRIFMADEEFIGRSNDDASTARINSIMQGIIERKIDLQFETNTRVDQIYNPGKSRAWHIERLAMLGLCRDAGLDRLLLGVESGSDSVLARFNKGISSVDSLRVLRLISAMGIGFRITFITFDPLMTFSELMENVAFLGRRDAYLKPLDCTDLGWEKLYEGVHDDAFVEENSTRAPLYEHVSYMLVSLEVLTESAYATLVRREQLPLAATLTDDINVSMARYRVHYTDPRIEAMAIGCQKWIDHHFALDYCLKGLYKTVPTTMRNDIFALRQEYRKVSYDLLKFLVAIFQPAGLPSVALPEEAIDSDLKVFRRSADKVSPQASGQLVSDVLDLFNLRMSELVRRMDECIASGSIRDPMGALARAITNWRATEGWALLNP